MNIAARRPGGPGAGLCAGFWFYSTQFDFGRPVHAKYWGYHEHMHVFITIAFVMHAAAIHFFVSECTTMPRQSAES